MTSSMRARQELERLKQDVAKHDDDPAWRRGRLLDIAIHALKHPFLADEVKEFLKSEDVWD